MERLSDSYLKQANEAERYFTEVKGKISTNHLYKKIFDEHLAKFYVYNHLHGRTFLSSKEALLNKLNDMLETYKITDTDCYDEKTFQKYLEHYIRYEIKSINT